CAGADRIGRRDMAGVGGRAVADDLGDDRGAPFTRGLELLEDQDPCPLPHDEAIALQVEGTAREAGFDVASRYGTRGAEGCQRQGRDTGFTSARDHGRGGAPPDRLEGLANRVSTGTARRNRD